jgi:sugar phosphate isomerase/epimerase
LTVISKIHLPEYTVFKLGFTTQNFLNSLDVSVASAQKCIDYAAKAGFVWIELRDPDASLSADQCRKIADYARGKHIEISYAIQRGLLDPDFSDVYQRGLPNAAAFKGPGTIRVLLSGKALTDPTKPGLSADELDLSVSVADEAARVAQQQGAQLVVENSTEPLIADGIRIFGLSDFFQRADSAVGWQMDTGNFFSIARDKPTPDQVIDFLNRNADNLFYLHLKSIRDGEVLPVLTDNVLDFGTLFKIISGYRIQYLAIELPSDKDERQNCRNLDLSLDYLRQKGFIK